jgi:ABC-2 type transport system permease protein
MKKIGLVLKNEFITVVTRPSFLITLFLLPVLGFIVMAVVGAIAQNQPANLVSGFSAGNKDVKVQGLIDQGNLIKEIPVNLSSTFIKLENETSAKEELTAGKIDSYIIIPADYIARGEMILVQKDFNFFNSDSSTASLQALLSYNLVVDKEVVNRFNSPLNLKTEYISPLAERSQADAGQFIVPYVIMMLLYVLIITSASLLLTSITSEKQNRVMEILLTSSTPLEMLTGKIIALGLVGLLQMITWFGSGFLLLRLVGRQFSLGSTFNLPSSILFWGIIFFILGYALYASLMAGLGALVPNLREANQATILVIFPLIIPILFSSSVAAAPNSPLFLALSLIPFTSPITMISRLAATDIPFWQLILSTAILAGTVAIVLRSVARLFRAQTLLSGNPFKPMDFFKALIKGK